MASWLGCFSVFLPGNSKARAVFLAEEDDDLERLIESFGNANRSGGMGVDASSCFAGDDDDEDDNGAQSRSGGNFVGGSSSSANNGNNNHNGVRRDTYDSSTTAVGTCITYTTGGVTTVTTTATTLVCTDICTPTTRPTSKPSLSRRSTNNSFNSRLSVTETSTSISASSSSLYSHGGIGSLSGKAIMAVGNLVIKGIEAVDIRVRLRRIASEIVEAGSGGKDGSGRVPARAVRELIEFQRAGLYPRVVRKRAMQLVVLLMCRRQTFSQLVDALLRQPEEEVRLFLHQLCALRVSGKTFASQTFTLISSPSQEDDWTYREKRHTTLSGRFCSLVLFIVDKHPSILLESSSNTTVVAATTVTATTAVEEGQKQKEALPPLYEVVRYLIKKGRGEEVDVSRWEDGEVVRFLRRLNKMRLAGWPSKDLTETYPFLAACIQDESVQNHPLHVTQDSLTEGFCDVVSTIVESRPSILCRAFSSSSSRSPCSPVAPTPTSPLAPNSQEELLQALRVIFERRHFRTVVSTLLACRSEDVRVLLRGLASGPPRKPDPLISILTEPELLTRVERQTNFSDLLRRIQEWHPHFLYEVFNTLEQFAEVLVAAISSSELDGGSVGIDGLGDDFSSIAMILMPQPTVGSETGLGAGAETYERGVVGCLVRELEVRESLAPLRDCFGRFVQGMETQGSGNAAWHSADKTGPLISYL